jgi:hypothetical protein
MKPRVNRAKAVLVVVSFVVISIGLTWIWHESVRALYGQLFTSVALKLHGALDLGHAPIAGLRQRYVNFVPFVALLLVTPGLALRRRLTGLCVGIFTISISHLAVNLTALMTPGPSIPVLVALLSDTFPFLIWFIVAFPVLAKFMPGATTAGAFEQTPESEKPSE